jgi:excisionase family DNA binding protein
MENDERTPERCRNCVAPPVFATQPEVARRTGLSRHEIREAVKAGELTLYKFRGWPRLKISEVREWMESKRQETERRTTT